MRHVITGGSGFTGLHLASFLLRRGEDVVLFDRRPPSFDHRADFIHGDVTVAGDLDRLGLRPGDVVYHLAARQFADAVPRPTERLGLRLSTLREHGQFWRPWLAAAQTSSFSSPPT